MTAVILVVVLTSLLIAVGLAFAWQESHAVPESAVVYGVDDAIDYVYPRLSETARARLTRTDVSRILEWEVKYMMTPDLRTTDGEPPVVGGINAARYAQERLMDSGRPYDGPLVLEVLQRQAEYLVALGAVGDPVSGDELRTVLEQSGESSDG